MLVHRASPEESEPTDSLPEFENSDPDGRISKRGALADALMLGKSRREGISAPLAPLADLYDDARR